MQRLWEAHRGKTDTKSLTQNLNWLNKLTSQLEYLRRLIFPAEPVARPIRIAYTQNGRPTAALITDNRAILDRSLYQVTCSNLDEAYYLLAIINSNALAQAAKPFCSTNWAKEIRALEKHLWLLPIPEYDPQNPTHTQLSRLGRTAAQLAQYQLTTLTARHAPTPITADRLRADLRNHWQTQSQTANQIETTTTQLLTPPPPPNS